ncbi:MAG TPA: nucleotidyltransferase domain-containing protein, partial [Gammaproteobacteria bacterium]|nr:nucleotidyltransferase domain-containing protein [Gammaproteobacteria bacterium]
MVKYTTRKPPSNSMRMAPTVGQLIPILLDGIPETQAIYLFGSHARGQSHPDSDLDLAILAKTKLPATLLWETAQRLASHAGVDVDLVNLGEASTVMQMQIITADQRLYCKDERACGDFEDLVFSSYARLNEERAEILRDIAERGRV